MASVALVLVVAVSAGCVSRTGVVDPSTSPSVPGPRGSGCGGAAFAAVHWSPGDLACTWGAVTPPALRPRVASFDSTINEDNIRLRIATDKDTYATGEPIAVTTTMAFLGPGATLAVGGSGGGIVHFSVRQLDGDLEVDAAMTSDCRTFELKANDVQNVPFAKSGGYSEDGSAKTAFMKAYFADATRLTLPAGTWEIVARADYVRGAGCSGGPGFAAVSVVVTVS